MSEHTQTRTPIFPLPITLPIRYRYWCCKNLRLCFRGPRQESFPSGTPSQDSILALAMGGAGHLQMAVRIPRAGCRAHIRLPGTADSTSRFPGSSQTCSPWEPSLFTHNVHGGGFLFHLNFENHGLMGSSTLVVPHNHPGSFENTSPRSYHRPVEKNSAKIC